MEKYRKNLVASCVRSGGMSIIVILAYFLFINPGFVSLPKYNVSYRENDFLSGFTFGAVAGVIAVAFYFIIKTIVSLKKPEKLQKMYVESNDERTCLISQKTGSSTCVIMMFLFVLASIVFYKINSIISLVCFAAVAVMLFVYLISIAYYSRKY